MLSQLLDGTIACAARGDCIEVAFQLEPWQGAPGVVVAVRLMQALGPGGGGAAVISDTGGHIYLSEFSALAGLARQAGGWFDIKTDTAAQVVQHSMEVHSPSAGSLSAALWLPAGSAAD